AHARVDGAADVAVALGPGGDERRRHLRRSRDDTLARCVAPVADREPRDADVPPRLPGRRLGARVRVVRGPAEPARAGRRLPVAYSSVDALGNTEMQQSVELTRDSTPPAIAIAQPAASEYAHS